VTGERPIIGGCEGYKRTESAGNVRRRQASWGNHPEKEGAHFTCSQPDEGGTRLGRKSERIHIFFAEFCTITAYICLDETFVFLPPRGYTALSVPIPTEGTLTMTD
jgi:hypothetical protein